MNAVPFSVDVYAGFGECHGLLKDDGDHLVFEFQTQDAVAGVLRSDVKRVRVSIDDLVSVTLTKGWLGTNWLGVKLVILANSLSTLGEIPGMSQGRVELSIARKDVEAAEQFIEDFCDSSAP